MITYDTKTCLEQRGNLTEFPKRPQIHFSQPPVSCHVIKIFKMDHLTWPGYFQSGLGIFVLAWVFSVVWVE